MPETANQGAASQLDIPTTSYTVTVVEQRIYRIPVSGPIEYPDRGAQSSTTAGQPGHARYLPKHRIHRQDAGRSKSMSTQSFTVTTDDGNSHYYKIASIEDQPNSAAIITIITGDLLDPGAYPATLVDGDNRVKGEYALFNVLSNTERVQYVGIFTPARQVRP